MLAVSPIGRETVEGRRASVVSERRTASYHRRVETAEWIAIAAMILAGLLAILVFGFAVLDTERRAKEKR